jgi:hypothetical protein
MVPLAKIASVGKLYILRLGFVVRSDSENQLASRLLQIFTPVPVILLTCLSLKRQTPAFELYLAQELSLRVFCEAD